MTAPYRASTGVTVHHGDSLDVLRSMPDASVHAIVTDPPYGLTDIPVTRVTDAIVRWASGDREHAPHGKGFMGREWDRFVPPPAVWDECLRVLRPGGHLLCFSGSRTVDLMGTSIRLAGFDMRDSLAWIHSQGFPKAGDMGERVAARRGRRDDIPDGLEDAWSGYAAALKPALEPVLVARKPFRGTLVDNVIDHGAGAYDIDGCRITTDDSFGGGASASSTGRQVVTFAEGYSSGDGWVPGNDKGRWPANVVLSHTPGCRQARSNRHHPASRGVGGIPVPAWECAPGCQVAALDAQSGTLTSGANPSRRNSDVFGHAYGEFTGRREMTPARGADSGGASRFYYCAKANRHERPTAVNADGETIQHNTVKPLDLMRWLVRLVSPPGAVVLDPFAGSGTTLEAALLEGLSCIGIEGEADHLPLIDQRLDRALQQLVSEAS